MNDEFSALLHISLSPTLGDLPGDGTKKEDGTKKRKKKEKKDPNLPKRPMASYIYFSNHFRQQVKEENPSADQKEIARLMGQRWKDLGIEEKKVRNSNGNHVLSPADTLYSTLACQPVVQFSNGLKRFLFSHSASYMTSIGLEGKGQSRPRTLSPGKERLQPFRCGC